MTYCIDDWRMYKIRFALQVVRLEPICLDLKQPQCSPQPGQPAVRQVKNRIPVDGGESPKQKSS